MYGEYYHDVGISISDNPYYLVILSEERNNDDLKTIFQSISQMIYEINELVLKY